MTPFTIRLTRSCRKASGAIYFQQNSIIWSIRRRANTVLKRPSVDTIRTTFSAYTPNPMTGSWSSQNGRKTAASSDAPTIVSMLMALRTQASLPCQEMRKDLLLHVRQSRE